MAGSATVTMVTSTRSMKVPMDTAIRGDHLRMPSDSAAPLTGTAEPVSEIRRIPT